MGGLGKMVKQDIGKSGYQEIREWRERGQRCGFMSKRSKIFENVQKQYRNVQKLYQNYTETIPKLY